VVRPWYENVSGTGFEPASSIGKRLMRLPRISVLPR
jgi:hypothetical protein